ncbi:MAG: TIGR01777 family oxidoreductase [Bacteroidia bacterium]|nr:TIGR01777 family oxidoreductase [Bacteroidia bacterium]
MMKNKQILIAGGSGLVGTYLSQLLSEAGHSVRWLSRSVGGKPYPTFKWDIDRQSIDEAAFKDIQVIINLAGAGIADKKWTSARKKMLIESRTKSSALLDKYIQKLGIRPQIYISAGGIGYYGDRGSNWMDESALPGNGFLSQCCVQWEEAVHQVSGDFPKAILRIGVVLSSKGGALEKMLLPLRFHTNTYFGNGKQYMSWIHIEDLGRIFQFFIESPTSGIFNAVADHPLENKTFVQEVAKGLGKNPILLPAPEIALRLAMGEMADVVLESTRADNKKIKNLGFEFKYQNVSDAVSNLFVK